MSEPYFWQDIYSASFKSPSSQNAKTQLPSPPGFLPAPTQKQSSGRAGKTNVRDISLEKLRISKNWEYSYSPLKNLPMNCIMSYFSPNSLQLIPILMTFNLFLTPMKEIVSNLGRFDDVEGVDDIDITFMKLCYIGSWLCNMAIGVWKLNQMGLIPNTRSDWLTWEVVQTFIERS